MPGWERTRGLQLWVNLAREYKMVEPEYQELGAQEVPVVTDEAGVTARVIAGTCMGVTSSIRTRTPVYYLDFTIKSGSSHIQQVPQGWTVFVYILAGSFQFEERTVSAHHTVV